MFNRIGEYVSLVNTRREIDRWSTEYVGRFTARSDITMHQSSKYHHWCRLRRCRPKSKIWHAYHPYRQCTAFLVSRLFNAIIN